MDIFDQIDKRKAAVAARQVEQLNEIQRRFSPLQAKFDAKLREIGTAHGARRHKFIKLQEIVSEVRAVAAELSACRKGCSACCHLQVAISQTEADAIGHRIGRPAVQLRHYQIPDMHSFGRHSPCTFLVDGECSIYESRPFICRSVLNLDSDELLCGFENWDLTKAKDPRATDIPQLAPGPMGDTYNQLSGQDVRGDIRDFFPKV